jgi:HEAT repeat protein
MLRKTLCFVAASGCLLVTPVTSKAEVFVLRKGKSVHGTWLNKSEDKPSQYRIETSDGFEITIDAKDVEKIEQPAPLEKAYLENADQIADSAEAHEKVVLQLEKDGMNQLANAHRERIVELDPKDGKSWRKLKYLEVEGEWISEAKYARRFGVVKDGKWVLSLEHQLNKLKEARKQAETLAGKKVDLAVKDIRDQSPRRYDQQLQYLRQLDDPDALPKIRDLVIPMRDEADTSELRMILMQAVVRMDSNAAKVFLCDAAIFDPDIRIRNLAVDAVKETNPELALQSFLRHLSSKEVQVIERAGEALDALGDDRAIPFLIEALVTRLRVQVGGGGSQTNAGFSSDGGTNFSPGGGKPQFREFDHNNLSVLQALQNLSSGVNYEYDKGAWLRWFADKNASTGKDLRRDP